MGDGSALALGQHPSCPLQPPVWMKGYRVRAEAALIGPILPSGLYLSLLGSSFSPSTFAKPGSSFCALRSLQKKSSLNPRQAKLSWLLQDELRLREGEVGVLLVLLWRVNRRWTPVGQLAPCPPLPLAGVPCLGEALLAGGKSSAVARSLRCSGSTIPVRPSHLTWEPPKSSCRPGVFRSQLTSTGAWLRAPS